MMPMSKFQVKGSKGPQFAHSSLFLKNKLKLIFTDNYVITYFICKKNFKGTNLLDVLYNYVKKKTGSKC